MKTIIHDANSKEFILDSDCNETRVGDKIQWGDEILTVTELFIDELQIGANNEEESNYITAFSETFSKAKK